MTLRMGIAIAISATFAMLQMIDASTAHAQDNAGEAPAAPPRPCTASAEFDQFDFWVGDWNVQMADGRKAGENHVTRIDGGCVVQEKWQSVAGGTGTSLNFYDVATGQWVQQWVGAGGTVITIRGGLEEESMVLEGHIVYASNGTKKPFRGAWTPLEDGRVRQYFQESPDNGETWEDWFEGFYSRIPAND